MDLVWRALRALTFAAALCAAASESFAQPFGYGGRFVNSDGKPETGHIDLEVRFFTLNSGGTQLGPTIDFNNVELIQGVFQITIDLNPTDRASVFGAPIAWIQIKDKTNNRILPRQQFLAVPYALRVPVDGTTIAFNDDGKLQMGPDAPGVTSYLKIDASGNLLWEAGGSGTVGPDQVETASIQDGAVTLNKIDDDAINSAKIVDGSVGNSDIADLDAAKLSGTVPYSTLPVGTAANTVAAGDDARLTNSRAPTGAAGGKLSGTYPNPGVNLADTDIPTLTSAKISDFATATQAAELDPQVGANTTNYLSKWNGSALVASQIFDNGSNIGIGTGSPSTALHVVAASAEARIAGTATNQDLKLTFQDNNATRVGMLTYEGAGANKYLTIDANGAGGGLKLQSSDASNTPIVFYVNGGEKVRMTDTGRLGIGTWNPQSALAVNGGASLGSYAATDSAPSNGLIVSGNVGIGTSAPQSRLHVANTSGSPITLLQHGGGAHNAQLTFLDEASNVKWGMIQYGDGVGAGLSNALTIYQATNTADAAVNQYRLVINDAGNVGIGTNSPTAKLHVGGTAGTDGIRFPDGTLQTTAAAGVGNICFCIQFRCNGGTNVGTEQCGTWGNYTSYAAPTTNCAGLGQAENARIRLYTCP